jgi:DnaK suppressor protein
LTLKIRTLLSSPSMATKIPKNYKPTSKEKYMCAKHKAYFKQLLFNWKLELIEQNNRIVFNDHDDNSASADVIDQATSYTGKTVEMKTVARNKKLINKIDNAVSKIEEGTYGYCEETGEEIGLKRLMARPIASLTVEAQENHEKQEKVFADD